MSDDGKKQIVIGVAIAVIGGLLLTFIEPVRTFVVGLLAESWRLLLSASSVIWTYLTHDQKLNGFILVISVLSLVLVLVILIVLVVGKLRGKAYRDYVTDSFHGVNWRWNWRRSEIESLWCFCPTCDYELAYDDSSTDRYSHDPNPRTILICDHCQRDVASIRGCTKDYLVSIVEREIKRKVRNRLHTSPSA